MGMQNRVLYLDVLRVLAIFSVVMLHVSCVFLRANTVGWYVGNFYDSISRWCVPVFVMISGALFLQPQKEISLKLLYSKYILRLAGAFVVWCLLYVFLFDPVYPIVHNLHHGLPFSYEYDTSFLPKYHLWFLLMLIGIYMLIPIMKEIARNSTVCLYFIILWFVFTTCDMLFHYHILNCEAVSFLFYNLQVKMVLGYSGYFLLGYWLSVVKLDKIIFRVAICIFLLMSAFTFGAATWVVNNTFFEYLMPNIILMSVSVFIIVRYIVENHSSRIYSILIEKTQGKLFGVYLIHAFFISIIPPILKLRGIESVFMIPILSVLVFCFSLLTIKLLQKLPYFRYFCS